MSADPTAHVFKVQLDGETSAVCSCGWSATTQTHREREAAKTRHWVRLGLVPDPEGAQAGSEGAR